MINWTISECSGGWLILITDRDQVVHVLTKLVQKRTSGTASPFHEKKKLSLKFELGKIQQEPSPQLLSLEKVSREAISYLSDNSSLEVNILIADKRISFTSQIFKIEGSTLWVLVPSSLTQVERRNQKRIRTNFLNTVFFKCKEWRLEEKELDSPLCFTTYKHLATWIFASDISEEGLCIESMFPAFFNWSSANPNFSQAEIIFPMTKPCKIDAEIRWVKRIREFQRVGNIQIPIYKYLAGLQIRDKDSSYDDAFHLLKNKLGE